MTLCMYLPITVISQIVSKAFLSDKIYKYLGFIQVGDYVEDGVGIYITYKNSNQWDTL